jgi:uncharacterized protein
MRIHLDQVREEPFSWDETQSVSPQDLDRPELLALSPVRWQGQVVFADPGYYLKGRLTYEQTLACIRCLAPIVEPAAAEVELMIEVERHGRTAGAERELEEEELGLITVEGETLDTDPILLEQLQLGVPMKPLCRPDCKGLCPVCGADRNVTACSCAESKGDQRWAALGAVKSRLGGKNEETS